MEKQNELLLAVLDIIDKTCEQEIAILSVPNMYDVYHPDDIRQAKTIVRTCAFIKSEVLKLATW